MVKKNKSPKNNILYFILAYLCLGIAFIVIIYPLSYLLVELLKISPIGYLIFDLSTLVILYIVIDKIANKMDTYFSGIRFVSCGRWISCVIMSSLVIILYIYQNICRIN